MKWYERHRDLIWFGLGILCILAVLEINRKTSEDDLRDERNAMVERIVGNQIRACETVGNRQSGYLLWRAGTVTAKGQDQALRVARRIFVLRNCEATYRSGHIVRMTPTQARRYVATLASGRVPQNGGKP